MSVFLKQEKNEYTFSETFNLHVVFLSCNDLKKMIKLFKQLFYGLELES